MFFSLLLGKSWDMTGNNYLNTQITAYYQSDSENFLSNSIQKTLDSF